MKVKECPQCECEDFGDRWCKGRKLQQHCYQCGWTGEPRTPEIRKISNIKEIYAGQFPGFNYHLFDKYGHVIEYSKGYNKKEDALKEINRRLNIGKTDENAGPYTAILWPSVVIVEGEIYT